MKNYVFGHTSFETALEIKDYPWGFRLRTSKFYWLETAPKKGSRLCTCTRNPKNGAICATKKGNYYPVAAMFINSENGHVGWDVVGMYDLPKLDSFIAAVGQENFTPEQIKMIKQLKGEKIEVVDEFTGEKKKDFKIYWTGDYGPRLTFDRPDVVSVKEIFEAVASLDQKKVMKAFEDDGFIRICVRKGVQLTTLHGPEYLEYLASDHATKKETVNA